MIKQTPKGFVVFSEDGKRLGGPYPSKAMATKRLKQVEHFKNIGKGERR